MDSKNKELDWFNIVNYPSLNDDHRGMVTLAKLLWKRARLYKGIRSDFDVWAYDQIVKGDPYFKTGKFKLITFSREDPEVEPMSGYETQSIIERLIRNFPTIYGGEAKDQNRFMGEINRDVNEVFQNESPTKRIHISVNLTASTEKLLKDFKTLVLDSKKKYNALPKSIKTNEKRPRTYFKQFTKYRVLPYLDLKLWAQIENKAISNTEIGRLIFSPGYDSAIDKTLVDHTIPHSERALDANIISLMWNSSY